MASETQPKATAGGQDEGRAREIVDRWQKPLALRLAKGYEYEPLVNDIAAALADARREIQTAASESARTLQVEIERLKETIRRLQSLPSSHSDDQQTHRTDTGDGTPTGPPRETSVSDRRDSRSSTETLLASPHPPTRYMSPAGELLTPEETFHGYTAEQWLDKAHSDWSYIQTLEVALAALQAQLRGLEGVIEAARKVAGQYKITPHVSATTGAHLRFLDLIGDEASEDDLMIALIEALAGLASREGAK